MSKSPKQLPNCFKIAEVNPDPSWYGIIALIRCIMLCSGQFYKYKCCCFHKKEKKKKKESTSSALHMNDLIIN